MKQKIYITGLAATMIVFLGGVLKVNHLPGAGIMLIVGMSILLFGFVPFALANHYKAEGSRQTMALYIVTGLTCFVVFGSMLFKIMHWSGAGIALIISLPFPYVVFLPVFLAVTGKNKNLSIHNTVYVLFLLSGISVISVLLSLNVSKERIDDSLQLSRSYNMTEKALDNITASAAVTPLAGKIDDLLIIIDDYQSRIFAGEGLTEEEWEREPWGYPYPDAVDIYSRGFRTDEKNPSRDTRLQNGLKDLVSLLGSSSGYEELASASPLIFRYRDYPGEHPEEWTRQMFMVNNRSWSLIYLDALETSLKMLRVTIQ